MKLGVTFALAALSLSASAARAQEPAPAKQPVWAKACEADAQKLCKDVLTKGGSLPDCLASHDKELSAECTETFLWRYKIMQDCHDDIEKVCKANGDPKLITQCFNERQKELSEKCRTALHNGKKRQTAETKAADPAKAQDDKAEKTAKAEGEEKPAKKKASKKKPAAN